MLWHSFSFLVYLRKPARRAYELQPATIHPNWSEDVKMLIRFFHFQHWLYFISEHKILLVVFPGSTPWTFCGMQLRCVRDVWEFDLTVRMVSIVVNVRKRIWNLSEWPFVWERREPNFGWNSNLDESRQRKEIFKIMTGTAWHLTQFSSVPKFHLIFIQLSFFTQRNCVIIVLIWFIRPDVGYSHISLQSILLQCLLFRCEKNTGGIVCWTSTSKKLAIENSIKKIHKALTPKCFVFGAAPAYVLNLTRKTLIESTSDQVTGT